MDELEKRSLPDGEEPAGELAASEPATEHDDTTATPGASANIADAQGTGNTTVDADAPITSPESGEHAAEISTHAATPTSTADEAANPADVEPDADEQDTEEYRA